MRVALLCVCCLLPGPLDAPSDGQGVGDGLWDGRPGELGPARPKVCRHGPWKQRGTDCLER